MFILTSTTVSATWKLFHSTNINFDLQHATNARMGSDGFGLCCLGRQSKVNATPTPSIMSWSEACSENAVAKPQGLFDDTTSSLDGHTHWLLVGQWHEESFSQGSIPSTSRWLLGSSLHEVHDMMQRQSKKQPNARAAGVHGILHHSQSNNCGNHGTWSCTDMNDSDCSLHNHNVHKIPRSQKSSPSLPPVLQSWLGTEAARHSMHSFQSHIHHPT